MRVGDIVWYSGEKLSTDLLSVVMFLYITKVMPITFLSNDFLY